MTLYGFIYDSIVLTNILGGHAENQDISSLEEIKTRTTVDIIGRVVLDTQMHAQASENDFVSAFRIQSTWLLKSHELNPFVLFNPMRPIIFQSNKWRMDRIFRKTLEERYTSQHDKGPSNGRVTKSNRSIVDLALDVYHEERGAKHKKIGIDATFKRFAIDQIMTFMFAGHATISSTIWYVAYALSEHPEALRKVRQEYNEVFRTDVEQTPHPIKRDPYLINKLPYTVAIIKEILRLYVPASSVRKGLPGFSLQHDGKQYPKEVMCNNVSTLPIRVSSIGAAIAKPPAGFMIWPISHALHYSPDLWPSPTAFIPERWLVKKGDPLFPIKGARRPFEFDPRHCIELVARDAKDGVRTGLRTTPDGERAYQPRLVTAKPGDGMPVRVMKTKA